MGETYRLRDFFNIISKRYTIMLKNTDLGKLFLTQGVNYCKSQKNVTNGNTEVAVIGTDQS